MSTASIGSSTALDSVRSRIESFRSGQLTLSKEDLTEMKSQLSAELDALLNSYDTVDINGDGMSFDELATYDRSMGMPGAPRGEPPSLSKEEMTAMRDRIAEEEGGDVSAFDKVLENFDAADADQDGMVSADEFRKYCEDNGIEMPKPPKPEQHAFSSTEPSGSEDEDADDKSAGSGSEKGDLLNLMNLLLAKYASGISSSSTSSSTALLDSVQA